MKIIMLMLLLVSCASVPPHCIVQVDAVQQGGHPGKTYRVESGMVEEKSSDIRFMRYAKIVSNTFKLIGFEEAKPGKTPDFIVKLSYRVGSPRTFSETTINEFDGDVENSHRVDYLREVVIKGYKKDVNVFEVSMKSRGSSSDLEEVFPAMVAAGGQSVGSNETKTVRSFLNTEVTRTIASE